MIVHTCADGQTRSGSKKDCHWCNPRPVVVIKPKQKPDIEDDGLEGA
jgi:hypothetical protein